MNAPHLSDQLRDIHLPDAVSWWPPAIGWWIVLALLTGLVVLLIRWILQKRATRPAPTINWRPLFREELEQIRQQYTEQQNKQQLAMQLSELLRKIVLKEDPAANIAGLTGKAWLAALDQHFNYGSVFSESARAITEAPYNPNIDFNADGLLQLLADVLARDFSAQEVSHA